MRGGRRGSEFFLEACAQLFGRIFCARFARGILPAARANSTPPRRLTRLRPLQILPPTPRLRRTASVTRPAVALAKAGCDLCVKGLLEVCAAVQGLLYSRFIARGAGGVDFGLRDLDAFGEGAECWRRLQAFFQRR